MAGGDARVIHETLMEISGNIERRNKRMISKEFAALSMAEARALFILRDGSAKNMTFIARMLGVAVSTATATVDKLARKKLVQRSVGDADRRQWLVKLTPKAKKLVAELEKSAIEGTKQFLACLSKSEIAFLKKILAKIDNNLAAAA
jgi:DNA-binding MarR family transcriptional regulator